MSGVTERHHGVTRAGVTYGVAFLALPLLLTGATLWNGKTRSATPSSDPATTWLVAAPGRLVRANGLVESPSAQIVDRLPFPAVKDGGSLLAVRDGLVAVTRPDDLTRVDGRTGAVLARVPANGGSVAGDDGRLFLVRDHSVDLLDGGSLRPYATHAMGRIVSWATAPGALYAATASGVVTRVDDSGSQEVRRSGGSSPLLTATADGVAGYDSDHGAVFLVRDRRVETATDLPAGPATGFAASPDGRVFATIGRDGLVVADHGRVFRRALSFLPRAEDRPAIDSDHVYVPDGPAGLVRRFRIDDGLPEDDALTFGDPGGLSLDMHRNRQFLWFDDTRGSVAWAIHDGHARKITKFVSAPLPPSPSPSPPAPSIRPSRTPGTHPPSPDPPSPRSSSPRPPGHSPVATHSVRPTPSRSRTPTPSPTRTGKPTASPTRTENPLDRCGGELTALHVHNRTSTGPDPVIDVTICRPALGDDTYWIVSRSGGQWFAKREVDRERTYTVHLLNGSGQPGEDRVFMIVAGRTAAGRRWLQLNLDADVANTEFARDQLGPGIEIVSDTASTTS